jgi:hypothetical protein
VRERGRRERCRAQRGGASYKRALCRICRPQQKQKRRGTMARRPQSCPNREKREDADHGGCALSSTFPRNLRDAASSQPASELARNAQASTGRSSRAACSRPRSSTRCGNELQMAGAVLIAPQLGCQVTAAACSPCICTRERACARSPSAPSATGSGFTESPTSRRWFCAQAPMMPTDVFVCFSEAICCDPCLEGLAAKRTQAW